MYASAQPLDILDLAEKCLISDLETYCALSSFLDARYFSARGDVVDSTSATVSHIFIGPILSQ